MEIKRSRGQQCSSNIHWLSLAIMVLSLSSSATTSTTASICPSDVPESSVINTGRDQFFIDVDHPLQCYGAVIAWKICYYLAASSVDDLEETIFAVTVGVWRISGNSWYTLVDYKNIELRGPQSGFHCINITHPANEQFYVEPGTFVGFHTHNADPPKEVLELRAMSSTGGNLARRKNDVFCRFAYPGGPVSLSCFENVAGAMHVHVMVDGGDETTSTPPTTGLSTTTHFLPSTTNSDNDEELLTTTLSGSDTLPNTTSTEVPTTTSNTMTTDLNQEHETTTLSHPNQNGQSDQATSIRNRTVIATGVSIGGLILIIVILILVVVIVIVVVKHRRQNKLLNFKIKKDGHQHIGLDHFVIVSDMSNVPPGSILSSPVSLEPHPYEEAASTSTDESNIITIENPCAINTPGALCNPIYGADATNHVVSTPGALCNPIYGADANNVYQTISSEGNEYEDPDEKERSCAPYEVPVDQAKDETSVHKANAEYATVIKNREAVADAEEGNEQTKYNKTTHTQSLNAKVVLDPQRYSVLYQHYYKVLNECNTDSEDKEEEFMAPATNVEDLYAQVHKQKVKELSDKDIKILELLGSGQFGSVSRGTWKSPKRVIEVAVKTLVTKDKNISRVKLLQEAAIMGQFFHPNVIKLLGVVTKKDSLMLVIELASKGDLKKLLVSMLPDPGELLAPNSDKLLLGYCEQVAFGMHYLATKGFVHRDLAARNILITHDNILKIADFGMSRDLADEDYYISQGGKVPVKWTAPEAINYLKYSTASDVWSYGCLLYEIWSLGQVPYIHCSNSEALEKVQTGYRLPPPTGCSRAMYSIMINCWHPEAQARPSFKDILLELHGSEDVVLKVPKGDADTHKLANRIGGPLEAGEKMYTDLQWKYFTSNDYEEQI